LVLLLPGSRTGELRRHLPVLLPAWQIMRATHPNLRARMILPDPSLRDQANLMGLPSDLDVQVGGLHESLAGADLAIASTGTVTMECAYFGVPTVALYKTSWPTYQIAKRLITVDHVAMPNILANEVLFPEFIQNEATPENLARAALDLLNDDTKRTRIKLRLKEIIASLGGTGATQRAAEVIVNLLR